jgi:hypothetical protein
MQNSWHPSPRHGGSLYYLVGDFASQEIAFVNLIKVFAAIVHHGLQDRPGRREAARGG